MLHRAAGEVVVPPPETEPTPPALAVWNLNPWTAAAAARSLQSCPTLCDPIDGSPPGSPVPGTLQARVLEWGAIAFSAWTAREVPILLLIVTIIYSFY